MLNPNCSEACYKITSEVFKKFTHRQMNIFDDIIEMIGATSRIDIPIYVDGKDFEYTPYFEKMVLDLFLDYFEVESKRMHWTGDSTTYMKQEDYEKAMKVFCEKYGLTYKKDCYEKRFVDK
jgi:hypothetical protein